MAIKSLRVRNLQSHKDTLLEFVPGVNIIVGKSRHGKSALFRGLEKLARNRPISGLESWVHRGSPKDPIIIDLVTDDHEVSWQGPKDQKYVLDGEEFRGFGTEVPGPVAEALNLDPINCQFQFDQPFLLFDSPGAVARTLNRVVNLDAIDRGLGNASALKRANDRDIQAQEARIKELKDLEATFPDLEAAEEFITELEEKEKSLDRKAQARDRLIVIQIKLRDLKTTLAQIQVPAHVEARINGLMDKDSQRAYLRSRLEVLTSIQINLAALRSRGAALAPAIAHEATVAGLQEKLARQGQLKYTRDLLVHHQATLTGLRARANELARVSGQDGWVSELLTKDRLLGIKRKNLARLRALQEQIAEVRASLFQKLAIIRKEEKNYLQLWPGICPLCGK